MTTTVQPTLFRDQRRFDAWLDFHRRNPAVFRRFLQLAIEARENRKRFGARTIWEYMRWTMAFETDTDDEASLNDHHCPYFARLAMLRHPELRGLFVTKSARFDADDDTLLSEADRIDRERE